MKNGIPIFKLFDQIDVPDELKADFNRRTREIGAQAAPIVALLTATLVPFSIIFDLIIIEPQYYRSFIIVRSVCTCICLILFVIAKTSIGKQFGIYVAFFALIIVGLGSSILIHIIGYQHSYYAMLNIIYLGTMVVPMTSQMCLFACMILFASYLVPIFFYANGTLNYIILANNAGFQIETIIIAVIFSHFHMRKRASQIINEQLIINQRDQISQSLAQISALEKSRQQFIANITHDLKTPLSVIAGHVDLVRNKLEEIGDESGTTLRFITDAVAQSSRLLDSLTSIAMLDSDGQSADMKLYDYTEFMRSFCGRFSVIGSQSRIEFKADIPNERLVVKMDQQWMERVIGNLVQNAFKFTSQGGAITVRVFCSDMEVTTEVCDTGEGIDDEKLSLIFERKYQAREEDKLIGFGLGLSIVRDMLQRMGGTISVKSKVGQGSTFSFTLPLFEVQEAPVVNRPYTGPERRLLPGKREQNERRVSLKAGHYMKNIEPEIDSRSLMEEVWDMPKEHVKGRPTIMICEDTPGQLHLLIEALHQDYNLLIALDGREGLEKLENFKEGVDLVISDVRMPNMDGIEFCKAFFSDESHRLIPFILLTAYANEHEQLNGLAFGATDYLLKPFNQRILIEKINHWLTRRTYESLLEKMITDLEEKNEMISRFRSIITHEIRNPLAVLSGSDYYLKSLHGVVYDQLSEKQKKQWNHIEKTVALAQDINSILENAKVMEQSVSGATCKPVPVDTVVSMVMEYSRLSMDETQLVLDSNTSEHDMVLCDITMVRQIMTNLISNGIEAVRESGRSGSVTLKVRTDEHHLYLSVIDTGVGMTDEQRQNLFKYRVTTKKNGNGIGLYLSYKLLQLQNGNISCTTSKPGEGTTFTVQLPLAEKVRPELPHNEKKERRATVVASSI